MVYCINKSCMLNLKEKCMKKQIMLVVMMLSVILTSCQSFKNQAIPSPVSLDGEWNIVEVNGSAIAIKDELYIGFNVEDGRVYGYTGCNNIMGSFKQNSETGLLDLSQMISTLATGPNIDVERNVLNALGQVKGYKSLSSEEVALCNKKKRPIVILKKRLQTMALKDLNGEWNIVRVYGEDVQDGMEKQPFLTFDITKKTISGCAGCNMIHGSFVINDAQKQIITFQNVASTRMMCPDMTLENNIFQVLNETDHYGQLGNGNLVLYVDGKQVMELIRNNPCP